MAYILGYIFADGSIRIRRSGSELSIKSKDFLSLISMNNAMRSTIRISKSKIKTGFIHQLTISRKEIIQDLLKLGLTPRKSKIMDFPEVPKQFLYDFIRGYFDGDGHVRILGNSLEIIFTSGSKKFLQKLNIILIHQGIKSKVYSKLQGSWFYLSILNESREIFYKRLYNNPTIFLERKHIIFQRFFKFHHQLTIICKDCGRKVIKTGNNHKRCEFCKKEYVKELNRRSYRRRRQYGLLS
ncbi:MAG: LAGLIDADG family homing endonuclease [Promethearchaeota archaeon]